MPSYVTPQDTLKGHSTKITQIEFLANSRLASACASGTLRFWDVSAGYCQLLIYYGIHRQKSTN